MRTRLPARWYWLGNQPITALELAPKDSPIEFTLREKEGKVYLIAVNKSERPQTVHWIGTALRDRKAEVLFETHQAQVSGDTLRDDFDALGVHIYRLRAN